jgi:hypothetical protein
MVNLRQEIWSQIGGYLSISPVDSAKIVGIEQLPNENRHRIVWHEIFRDYKWLDRMIDSGYSPVLVGIDLHLLYNEDIYNADEDDVPIYLVLLCGEKCYEAGTMNPYTSVRASLRPHSSVGDGWEAEEVVLRHRNIRLSIGDNFTQKEWPHLPISAPQNLFSRTTWFTSGDGALNTSYLYYKNDYCILRYVGPSGIIGIGKQPSTKESVSIKYGITFEQPQKNQKSQIPWQRIFMTSVNRHELRRKWSDRYIELQPDPDSTLKPAQYCAGWEEIRFQKLYNASLR